MFDFIWYVTARGYPRCRVCLGVSVLRSWRPPSPGPSQTFSAESWAWMWGCHAWNRDCQGGTGAAIARPGDRRTVRSARPPARWARSASCPEFRRRRRCEGKSAACAAPARACPAHRYSGSSTAWTCVYPCCRERKNMPAGGRERMRSCTSAKQLVNINSHMHRFPCLVRADSLFW